MPREPIGIVTPKDRALSRAAQLFIDFTREGRETIGEEKIIDAMSASGRLCCKSRKLQGH